VGSQLVSGDLDCGYVDSLAPGGRITGGETTFIGIKKETKSSKGEDRPSEKRKKKRKKRRGGGGCSKRGGLDPAGK